MSRGTHRSIQVAVILMLLLAAWFAGRHEFFAFDLSAERGNSLSQASIDLLATLESPVTVYGFITRSKAKGAPATAEVRKQISRFIARFQRIKPDIRLRFVDQMQDSRFAMRYGVIATRELVIEYQGRHRKLRVLDEASFSGTLLQLAYDKDLWVVFTTGHQERSPFDTNKSGYSTFASLLKKRNIRVQTLDLRQVPSVPANTTVLVLAAPKTRFSAQEISVLLRYLRAGGNLIWLQDPEAHPGLEILAARLGVRRLPGFLSTKTGSGRSTLLIRTRDFGAEVFTPRSLRTNDALFVLAGALSSEQKKDYQSLPIVSARAMRLQKQKRSAETGTFVLGVALQKNGGKQPQRIIVFGDSDFLSNNYLHLGINRFLGLNMFNWLSHHEALNGIARPVRLSRHAFDYSATTITLISAANALLIPLLFVLTGIFIHRRRAAAAHTD